MASYKGHVQCLQVLAENGADLNKPSKDGVTPGFSSFFIIFHHAIDCEYISHPRMDMRSV